MAGSSYVPGSWLGVVRSGTAVLLAPDTPPALAGALWNLLGSNPEVHEVLHAVTSSSGGSLASIPSFGILDFNGSLRVFLRGGLELTVELPGGPVELNGRDVTTWNERRFTLPASCTVAIPGAGAGGLPELPLGEGAVLLQSLTLGMAPVQAAVGPGPQTAAVFVDSDGNADVKPPAAAPAPATPASAAEPAAPAEPAVSAEPATSAGDDAAERGTDVPVPDTNAGSDAIDLAAIDPDVTIFPDQVVSAETVFGVLDDDADIAEAAGKAPVGGEADVTAVELGSAVPHGGAGVDRVGSNQAGFDQTSSDHVESDAVGAVPATELTSSYDHLWERTVIRNIEDAAVREEPDANEAGHGPARTPALEPPAGRPALETAPGDEPASAGPAAVGTESAPAGDAEPGSGHRAAPAGALAGPVSAPPAGGVLIDSVPWRKEGAGAPPAPSPVFQPLIRGPQESPDRPGSHAPGAAAPVGPAGQPGVPPSAAPPAAVPAEAPGFDGDHDGQTVMKSNLSGMSSRPAPASSVHAGDPGDGPVVLARVCGQGHPNPPTRAQCSACGAALLPDAVQVARPRLGRVRVSTGELLDLDQSLVIGRQPSVSRVQGGVMPRLVQVASPGGDISRSHVEVRLEGWHVMLCDLKATNGTVLVREGQPPRRLAQNEMAILLDGDIAELGDNISLRFEEIP